MRREDIVQVTVTPYMMRGARRDAKNLARNIGAKTKDGGDLRDVKGSLGQQAVHIKLEDWNLRHKYSDPFDKDSCGDDFDIKYGNEIWDVKTRGWWNDKYFFNIKLYMGEHEEERKPDFYVFATNDYGMDYVYILGVIGSGKLWKSLKTPEKNVKFRFPSAGYIYSRELEPFRDFAMRV